MAVNKTLLALLAVLLLCCNGSGVGDGDGGPAVDGQIQFPRDESPHSSQMEWWYYTGRLQTAKGDLYGFQLTVFQPMIHDKPLYVGHIAISDLQQKSYANKMYVSGEDQRTAVEQGFDLKVGEMRMAGYAGKDKLEGQLPGYGVDLSLEATKPLVLQYGTGSMTIGSNEPFYYYSYTRMAASGTITVGLGGSPQQVTGTAWMDHQWGTIGTGYGWDWFSLRLDDLTEVMLFVVSQDGKPGFVGGTFVDADGKPRALGKDQFTISATGQWTSPHTEISYPHGWTIQIPELKLKAEVVPELEDQEFHQSFYGSPIYWEGLCRVTGTRSGKPVTGHAYVEITGNFK